MSSLRHLRPLLSARGAIALVGALFVTGVTAGLSRAPVPVSAEDEAMVRLSWRMAGMTQATCRPVTPEEQEGIPAHMRRTEVCDESPPNYRLLVLRNGEVIADEQIRGRGARGDRPLVVHREVSTTPGSVQMEVCFEPEVRSAQLPSFHFSESFVLGPRQVALITLDRDAGALRRVGSAGDPSPGDPRP